MGRSHTSPPAADQAKRAHEQTRVHAPKLRWHAPGSGFGALRSPKAPSVLGDDHPVSRSAIQIHTLAVQATATSSTVLLGALAVAEHRSWGVRLLSAAVLVELTLLAILALARQIQREHILRLIAGGGERLRLEEVSREVRRLANPRYSAQLAKRLERALKDAQRWHRIPIASRPPQGIRLLAGFAGETRAIVEQLRAGHAALPGVALLDLVLSGGYESTLYAGDREALREQLWRISHLMGHGTERLAMSEHATRRSGLADLAYGPRVVVTDCARRTGEQS